VVTVVVKVVKSGHYSGESGESGESGRSEMIQEGTTYDKWSKYVCQSGQSHGSGPKWSEWSKRHDAGGFNL
jgi:hypothetical protein